MTDHDEAVRRLQEMLRFDTTNPPGNELALVRHLAGQLQREGLDAQVLESAPERATISHARSFSSRVSSGISGISLM